MESDTLTDVLKQNADIGKGGWTKHGGHLKICALSKVANLFL